MDDGATPVEHGGARPPAHIPKFQEFSTPLLCLMSALQHRNFKTFETSLPCLNFRVITSSPHSAFILTAGSPNIAFFLRARCKYELNEKPQKMLIFAGFQ